MNVEPTIGECVKYIQPYIESFEKHSQWSELEVDEFKKEITEHLQISNPDFYRCQIDPIPWEGKEYSAVNKISAHSGRFRDRYIFESISEGLKTHNSLFIVFGSAHAVCHEPALRALMTNLL